MQTIVWQIMAQRRLLDSLESPSDYEPEYKRISAILGRAFPRAAVVVVRDRLNSFQSHAGKHVLLVETTQRTISLPRRAAVAGMADSYDPQLGTPFGIEFGAISQHANYITSALSQLKTRVCKIGRRALGHGFLSTNRTLAHSG
jgi:hypothetical protein